ncbi:MAG: hypothetical protein QOD14_768 [Solirubrobacterales bacterium]|jgi:hypothetical protein|nr:hypothetical protein [Solirubrobacterales bacterium]
MPEEMLERHVLPEVQIAPEESLVPPAPPDGLDTVLYEHDARDARADLRRQIAAMELALGRLFGSAFPRKGIDFAVPGMGGPRLLSVDELEKVRDALLGRIQDVKADLHDYAAVEEANRELIEEMTADPASHKWVRVYNEDIGEPGCKHWHAKPRWGPLGLLMGWWRVKISSGCPLAEGLRPPEPLMATKRQRRKRRRPRTARPAGQAPPATPKPAAARRRRAPGDRPPALWGDFPLTEIVIFIGLVLLVVGFFIPPPQGFVMIAVGLVLGSLAGLELSIREHFTAYRSHTLLLSAAVGVPIFGALFVATKLSPAVCLAAGLVAFGGAAWFFTSAFRRRSGGALYRFSG